MSSLFFSTEPASVFIQASKSTLSDSENTTLSCTTDGGFPPTSNISWIKNGRIISRTSCNQLTINVTANDVHPFGQYVCMVNNSVTTLQYDLLLKERGRRGNGWKVLSACVNHANVTKCSFRDCNQKSMLCVRYILCTTIVMTWLYYIQSQQQTACEYCHRIFCMISFVVMINNLKICFIHTGNLQLQLDVRSTNLCGNVSLSTMHPHKVNTVHWDIIVEGCVKQSTCSYNGTNP